jgi:1-acyl-sn-glycerol-3-phosphate acyltransferase
MEVDKNFDDIRPYRDEEVPEVLRRLWDNKWLISGLRAVFLPKTPGIFKPVFDWIMRAYLGLKLKNIHTIEDFQRKIIVDTLLHHMVKKTISGLSYEGLEHLTRGEAYIFISNHRDIVLDPALLDYILNKNNLAMAQIAFGDNLMFNDAISDLIRVNRGVIVKRDLPPREQFRESMRLSAYLKTVIEGGESLWIAQRSGRSKDGMDVTNPAIVKMLYFAYRREKLSFREFLERVRIVPVSISYEYDPCDRMKAWEIHRKRTRGEHKKRKYEDLLSIMTGIKGFKGKVHYKFSPPLEPEYENEKELAAAIDERIQKGYKLWSTNFIAYDIVHNTDLFDKSYSEFEKQLFYLRFRRQPRDIRQILLEAYANPVVNKMMYGKKT